VALGVLAGSLGFAATPALAVSGYGFTGSFGSASSSPPNPNPLSSPSGVAVNEASKDVYVVDQGNKRVEEFNSEGAFLKESVPLGGFSNPEAIAVDNSGSASDPSKEDVYVTDAGNKVIDKFSASGTYLGQITTGSGGVAFSVLYGVAVDPNGVVWVDDRVTAEEVEIDSYSDALVNAFSSVVKAIPGGVVEPGFAVDGEGNFYVGHREYRTVAKLNSSGGVIAEEVSGAESTAVAVDPSTNNVYINRGTVIEAFAPTLGSPIATFGSKHPVSGTGLAVSSATGTVYAADSASNEVDIFTLGETPEVPHTEAASGETTSSAVLHGKLNPKGVKTSYYFAYNTGGSCEGGGTTPVEESGEGNVEVEESAEVTGLEPDAQYTVCFVAENAFGPTFGAPVTFTTLIAPPVVEAESFSALTPFAVTIETKVNPNNQLTLCEVEYGTDPTLATNTVTACETSEGVPGWLPGEFGERAASAHIEGLEADTTYYYRVIANALESGEKGEGAIQSFTTVGPPQPSTGEAQSITRVTAALSGTVDPERGAGTYYFAYIDEAGFQAALAKGAENPYAEGATTAEREVAAGETPQAVQPLLAVGLLPETTYHYALVARNGAGVVIGNDMTFTTGAATPPVVTTGPASAITLSTATISGTLDTQGLDVSYAFEVSTEPGNPGPPSGGGSIGAGPTEAGVSLALQGLRAGTTYYYRLIATSTDGTSYGAVQTFTTPGFPSPLTQPATPPLIGSPQVAFPAEEKESSTTTPKRLTNAQKLAKALKACAKKPKSKRAACRKQAKKRYGPVKHKKPKKK
jgi:DNA-binding beta-propeller fold protein YncE